MTYSIIMPVYNVERYIRQGIDSVLAQTYNDFELILVDDCSPDNSPAICDEYAVKDKRVKVVHKAQNEGLGEARNTGLEAACGDYVLYMDSDDYIEPTLLESLVDCMADGTDIAVFGVRFAYENEKGQVYKDECISPCPSSAVNKEQIASCFIELSKARIFPFAWNKIYRRSFLQQSCARFERTKLIEDFLFNIYVFAKASKIVVVDGVFYNYRKPAHQTLANSYSPEFFALAKRKYNLELNFISEMGVDNDEFLQLVMSNHVKHIVSTIIRNGAKKANIRIAEQKRLVKMILQDEDTKTVLSKFKPCGLQFKVICAVLKSGNAALCLMLAKGIGFIQKSH